MLHNCAIFLFFFIFSIVQYTKLIFLIYIHTYNLNAQILLNQNLQTRFFHLS